MGLISQLIHQIHPKTITLTEKEMLAFVCKLSTMKKKSSKYLLDSLDRHMTAGCSEIRPYMINWMQRVEVVVFIQIS